MTAFLTADTVWRMPEQTSTCYELRVFVTVANDDSGAPEYSAEDIAEGVENLLRRCPGGCDVEIVATTTIDDE